MLCLASQGVLGAFACWEGHHDKFAIQYAMYMHMLACVGTYDVHARSYMTLRLRYTCQRDNNFAA